MTPAASHATARKKLRTPRKPRAGAASAIEEVLLPPAESNGRTSLTAPERQQVIAERAYSRAEQRGFAPGRELEDWLAAEEELNSVCSLMSRDPRF